MILVIEDDPVVSGVISAALKRRSLAHVVVRKAIDGYERAQRTPPDLIICDLGLPDVGGLDLIERLRSLPRMASVPIIVCTADLSRETVQKALQVGASDYIGKPIDVSVFEERVLRALRGQRAVPA
jgi:DNA-binding response OmpR family regulator